MGDIAVAGNSMVCKTGGSDESGSTYWNCCNCDKAGGCFNLFAKADFSQPKKLKAYLKQKLSEFKHRKGCIASRSKKVWLLKEMEVS